MERNKREKKRKADAVRERRGKKPVIPEVKTRVARNIGKEGFEDCWEL